MQNFLTLLLLVVFPSISGAKGICPQNYKPPAEYQVLQAKVDKSLVRFSNKPVIAKQADTMLSKLLAAKSPVILSWMAKRDLQGKNEEAIVRTWRQYYATQFVLSKYPHGSPKVDRSIEQFVEEIRKLFSNETFVDRMEKLFRQSQQASLKVIKGWRLDKKSENQLVKRVSNIKLYWMRSFKTSKLKALPLEYTNWGIAYDPAKNEINMGIHSLAYPNDETYLAVFAHEIGHSFDSCRWGAFFSGDWPFAKVAQCLRSAKSVGAKKRDDSQMVRVIKAGRLSQELAVGLKMNPTCNKRIYPPPGIQADQLPESFADWFSAEAVARLKIKSPLNLRSDLCQNKELMKGSSYVSNHERLSKIYFAHPKFRGQIKAGLGETVYCPLR